MSVSKVMTLTSTYDHRVIQGAQSGVYLARLHALLLGEDGFYDDIFGSLRIPYEPIRWAQDVTADHENQIPKEARILEMINSYRVRGHLMADTDPLEYRQRGHHDLDVQSHGLTLWDLDREFPTGSFAGGQGRLKMRKILGILRDSYCRTIGIEYMHMQEPVQRKWIQDRVERPHESLPREEHLRTLDKLNEAEIFETFLQTKFVGQKRFSLEGGESAIALLDEVCEQAAEAGLKRSASACRIAVVSTCWPTSWASRTPRSSGSSRATSTRAPSRVWRREVPPRLGGRVHRAQRSDDQDLGRRQSKPSRSRQPGAGGHRPGQAGHPGPGRHPCCLCCCMATRRSPARALWLRRSTCRSCAAYGRHDRHREQPGGLHHIADRTTLSMYCTDVARMIQAPIFHVNGTTRRPASGWPGWPSPSDRNSTKTS